MPCVVLTGAPGAGKTTLLAELASRGYRTVPESARAIVARRRAAGLSPRPEPEAFAREILRLDIDKYRAVAGATGWVFFDRSAVEAVAMVHEARPLDDDALEATLARLAFHRTVFVLPPWEDIYCTDAERDHTFEHAVRVDDELTRWYARCGYDIHVVPRLTVRERADHVLRALGCGSAAPG